VPAEYLFLGVFMKRVLKKAILAILIAFVFCNAAFLLSSCDTVLFRGLEGPPGKQGEQGRQGEKGDKGPPAKAPAEDPDGGDPDGGDPEGLVFYFSCSRGEALL